MSRGKVGTLDWEACDECFFQTLHGCSGFCELEEDPGLDDVICTGFTSEDDMEELTPELEKAIDHRNQGFLFDEINGKHLNPFMPRIFHRDGKKFIRKRKTK